MVKDGESWARTRRAFSILLEQWGDGATLASQYRRRPVGLARSQGRQGRPAIRSSPSPGAKQRECLKFLTESILCDKSFQFSPALLRRLGTERWSHWGSEGGMFGPGVNISRRAGLIATCTASARGLPPASPRAASGAATRSRPWRAIGRFVALRYALMRLGAVMVPMDCMLQADDVGFILNHSGARMLAHGNSGTQANSAGGKAPLRAPPVSEFLWLPSEEESAPVEGHRAEGSHPLHRDGRRAAGRRAGKLRCRPDRLYERRRNRSRRSSAG